MFASKTGSLRPLAALVVLFVTMATSAEDPPNDNWPQWRGPNRDSKIHTQVNWPNDLSGLKRLWRVELGPSYSGPIVYGERVFVTETEDERREVVRALNRDTGVELWRMSWDGALSVPFFAKANGDWIRSTPTCDGESLFVGGMRDVLLCLDVESGTVKWRVDFCERYGTPLPAFGMVCSPLLDGDHLYVQAGASFVKLEKQTGRTIWRSLVDTGGMTGSAFSSPVLATLHGDRQLIVQTRRDLTGVDPATGEVLWQQAVPAFRGMNILTPTPHGDGIFTSSYQNRTFFYAIDRQGEAFSVREAWTLPAQGYMSSPVVIDEYAYLHLGNGRLSCIDLRNGIQRWRSKPFGKYWSVVANRGRILALDQVGELLLIEADSEEFRLLDRREIANQETWAHLAVCDDQVFVRELKAMAVYRWK